MFGLLLWIIIWLLYLVDDLVWIVFVGLRLLVFDWVF